MAGDGGRVPDVSEQRTEKNHVCYIENGRCQFPGCFRRRSDDPASVLAALLAESPEATVAAIEALLTSDEAVEVAARALQGRYLGQDDWRTFAEEARTATVAACRSLLSKAPKEDG